ncbi:MAG TPA: ATP synthase F1 subunit delta [Pirellulaceae bacterium]|nr:ATP synthase F1 subunit delta [Pirellulaceae bacterium]
MADTTQTTTLDPARQQIGTVYAKAILGAAEKQGLTDAVLEELQSLVEDVVNKLPQFREDLQSPRLDADKKIALLERAFAGRMQPVLLTSLKVLARHGRLDCLRAILSEAHKLSNDIRGRIEVRVRTATPITSTIRDQIAQRLTAMLGKQVVLRTEIDAEMLGGITVRVGDTVLDGSVSAQLAMMREAAVEKTAARFREELTRFAVSTPA